METKRPSGRAAAIAYPSARLNISLETPRTIRVGQTILGKVFQTISGSLRVDGGEAERKASGESCIDHDVLEGHGTPVGQPPRHMHPRHGTLGAPSRGRN
jgi:hypothetical protein